MIGHDHWYLTSWRVHHRDCVEVLLTMTCPKCRIEQLEGSKFCSQCAAPLTTSNVIVRSKIPTWLAVVIVLFLAFIVVAIWNLTGENARLRAGRTDPSKVPVSPVAAVVSPAPVLVPMSQKLFTGQVIVKANGYVQSRFTVQPGMQNFHVVGKFNASGGTGNDIQAVIADEQQFTNWINGHQARSYYSTQKITTDRFDVTLGPGTYIIAFSNKFSAFTEKQVFAEVEAQWQEQR
jgi:hypothetical protein